MGVVRVSHASVEPISQPSLYRIDQNAIFLMVAFWRTSRFVRPHKRHRRLHNDEQIDAIIRASRLAKGPCFWTRLWRRSLARFSAAD